MHYRKYFSNSIQQYFPILLGLYGIGAVAAFWFFRYQVNSDGVAYISIAQKYLAGDWGYAINGFWSPLFSWCMVPLLALGVSGIFAVKMVNLLVGIGVLIAFKKLLEQCGVQGAVKMLALCSIIPLVWYCAVYVISPDLLVVLLLLLCIKLLTREDRVLSARDGVGVGVLAGIAYLAKTYMFPFMIVFLFVGIGIRAYLDAKEVRRTNSRNLVLGLCVFFLVSSAWIGTISMKYGYLTFGNTGAYNMEAYGPDSQGDPLEYMGLISPPDSRSLSVWVDPTFMNLKGEGFFSSPQAIRHWIFVWITNTWTLIAVLLPRMSVFLLGIIMLGLWMTVRHIRRRSGGVTLLSMIVAILLLPAGYVLIHIEERYVWGVTFLAVVLAGILFKEKWNAPARRLYWRAFILAVFASFMVMPLGKLGYRAYSGMDTYKTGVAVSAFIPEGARIASENEWSKSLFASSNAKGVYLGVRAHGMNDEQILRELRAFDVQYYLVWDETVPSIVKGMREVTEGAIPTLHVYAIE